MLNRYIFLILWISVYFETTFWLYVYFEIIYSAYIFIWVFLQIKNPPSNYDETYTEMARRGARVLALGRRELGILSHQEVLALFIFFLYVKISLI